MPLQVDQQVRAGSPPCQGGTGAGRPRTAGDVRVAAAGCTHGDAPELEPVACCIICGGTEAVPSDTIRWRDTDLHYVLCTGCGLKYMSPRPTERWYSQFYESSFWQEKVTYRGYHRQPPRRAVEADVGTQRRIEKQRWRARKIASILRRVARLSPATTVLEFGAAFGEALALLRERYGCRVLGVEPSEHARAYAQSRHGIEFVARHAEELDAGAGDALPAVQPRSLEGAVDVVVMSHVLENIVDPRRALATARRVLRRKGLLYIDTCNFYYNNAVNPYHPYVFSPETLGELLGRCGFEVVRQFGERHPRRVRWPSDPYFAAIARPSEPVARLRGVDVGRLVADQELGIRLRQAFKKRRPLARKLCAAFKRLGHGPSYSTYSD